MNKKYLITILFLFIIIGFVIFQKSTNEINIISNPIRPGLKNINTESSEIQKTEVNTKIPEPSLQGNLPIPPLNPTSTLSVDNLLDESDRTEKNKQVIQNHNNLVEIFKDLKVLRKDKNKVVTKEQLTKWVQFLIYDAHLSNELGFNNEPDVSFSDFQTLRNDLIPSEDNLSRLLNPDYIKALRSLAEQLSNIDTRTNPERALKSLAARTIDLAKRRKEQSEIFYLTLMHKYFPSQDYTMAQKISFAEQFVDAGDMKLAKYTMEYFQDSIDLPENQKDKYAIQQLIIKIQDGLIKK